MDIFKLQQKWLIELTDTQLEDIVLKLCEASLTKQDLSTAYVHGSGPTKAPDDGIDIEVKIPIDKKIDNGYIPNHHTVYQAKARNMPKAKIEDEMHKSSTKKTLARLASDNGAYIIVSSKDNCSPKMLAERIAAMQEMISGIPNNSQLNINFYDQEKLYQWINKFPSIELYVLKQLGKNHSGWEAFGNWSKTPHDAENTLVIEEGVEVEFPDVTGNRERLGILEGINQFRKLAREPRKSIRLIGLSGTGKTRLLEALFEKEYGKNALDSTNVYYSNSETATQPTPLQLFGMLAEVNIPAIIIIDNCSAKIHRVLTEELQQIANNNITLITVEYDIQDDQPENTDVVRLQVTGIKLCQKLIEQRFPNLNNRICEIIAEFSGGNLRVAIAIAKSPNIGCSITTLSDNETFKKLFYQRQESDSELYKSAKLLSLVYSYSSNTTNELQTLADITGTTEKRLRQDTRVLMNRDLAQARGNWRAILPQAIANKLAQEALKNIPIEDIFDELEKAENERLLTSFAHRISLLPASQINIKIATDWIKRPEFEDWTNLSYDNQKILKYLTKVVPDIVYQKLQKTINSPSFGNETSEDFLSILFTLYTPVIKYLAYDEQFFESCVHFLIKISKIENTPPYKKIEHFFFPLMSGTKASLKSKIDIIRSLITSNDSGKTELAFDLLKAEVQETYFYLSNDTIFEYDDYGYMPTKEEFNDNIEDILLLLRDVALKSSLQLTSKVKEFIESHLGYFLKTLSLQKTFTQVAKEIHNNENWNELYIELKEQQGYLNNTSSELTEFVLSLQPDEFIDTTVNILDEKPIDPEEFPERAQKAREIGKKFGEKQYSLVDLPFNIMKKYSQLSFPFGEGLAASGNTRKYFDEFLELANNNINLRPDCIAGLISELSSQHGEEAEALLDEIIPCNPLKVHITSITPRNYTQRDYERFLQLSLDKNFPLQCLSNLFYNEELKNIDSFLEKLAENMLINTGHIALLDGLGMRVFSKLPFSSALINSGIDALIFILRNNIVVQSNIFDGERFITHIFAENNFLGKKREIIKLIAKAISTGYGHLRCFQEREDQIIHAVMKAETEFFLTQLIATVDKGSLWVCLSPDQYSGSIFSDINIDVLINFCQKNGYWNEISTGINPVNANTKTSNDEVGNECHFSDDALKFLYAAPEPSKVLKAYWDAFLPRTYSGSRATQIESRLTILDDLINSSDTRIAIAAQNLEKELKEQIQFWKQEEANEASRNQSFE